MRNGSCAVVVTGYFLLLYRDESVLISQPELPGLYRAQLYHFPS